MQTRSGGEIARAALREVFPTPSEDGLDEAARHLTRWGVEGHGSLPAGATAGLMYTDMAPAAQESPEHVLPGVRTAARGGEWSWRETSDLNRRPGGRA